MIHIFLRYNVSVEFYSPTHPHSSKMEKIFLSIPFMHVYFIILNHIILENKDQNFQNLLELKKIKRPWDHWGNFGFLLGRIILKV